MINMSVYGNIRKVLELIVKCLRNAIRSYVLIQISLILLVVLIHSSFGVKAIVLLVTSVSVILYRRISRWFYNRFKLNTDAYKMQHIFVFTRSRAFWFWTSFASVITLILAVWFTWLVDFPGYDVYEETAEYIYPEQPGLMTDILYVVPNAVSHPCITLNVAYDATVDYVSASALCDSGEATEEELQLLKDAVNHLEEVTDYVEVMSNRLVWYTTLPIIFWLLYGVIITPAKIKNEVKKYENAQNCQ